MKAAPSNTFTPFFCIALLFILLYVSCTKVGSDIQLKFAKSNAGNNVSAIVTVDSLMNFQLGPGIWGYTDKVSYKQGDSVSVFLGSDTLLNNKAITVYDINGVFVLNNTVTVIKQGIRNSRPWTNGFGLKRTYAFMVPPSLKSGVYFVENKIPFVVKNKQKNALITIVYPSNTTNAYSYNGGKSLYKPITVKADTVSFLRPLPIDTNEDFFSPFLKWISIFKGYDVQYIADMDMDDYAEINTSKVLITIGHSEYWTRAARNNFDKFVASGKNALLLSGNNMYWQVRYTPDKTKLVCHRTTAKHSDYDPSNPEAMTYYWNYPPFNYQPQCSNGANYLWGAGVYMNSSKGYFINTPNSPLLEGTALRYGDRVKIKSYEYDGMKIRHNPVTGVIEADTAFLKNGTAFSYQVIGYDSVGRDPKDNGFFRNGTMFVYKPSPTSGYVFNTCSVSWCSRYGIAGMDGDKIKKITSNAITKSVKGLSLLY